MTIALVVWSIIFGVWMVAGAASGDDAGVANCVKDGGGLLTKSDCQTASDIGTGIGVTIGGLWFVGFIVLSIVWFMSRPKETR